MRKSIKQVLMERDGMSEMDADDLIDEAREEMMEHIANGDLDAAEDICMDYFGLEPDYLDELLPL